MPELLLAPLLPAASAAPRSSALRLVRVLPGKAVSTCLSHACSILCSVSKLVSFEPDLPDAFPMVVLLSFKTFESVCHLVGVALLTAILSALFSPECSCESVNHESFPGGRQVLHLDVTCAWKAGHP